MVINPQLEFSDSNSTFRVPLPDLGTGAAPVRISAWFVEVGDQVEAGDPILEVVIPGVTSDVCSPATGRICRILKDIDALVHPGDIVACVEPS
jgi:pyruvate dehydrogenase E2 component (dihydrolipoamide acetyltransferase)